MTNNWARFWAVDLHVHTPGSGERGVRLHEGIGYVTPADEHHGRGYAIRSAMQHNQPKHANPDEDN